MFQLTDFGQTRGHALKLTKPCTNRNIRLHFFSEQVINNWNLLDQMVVEWTLTVEVFKKRLYLFTRNKIDLLTD